ncbi:MAG: AGE family epimerase/isomerase [Phycisphaerae bacterium]|nr:AGE family epimerase/isomerase [Phycisphaerae bacterium]
MQSDRILKLRDQYRTALLDDVVPFWMKHGVDRECGGFFTCLERNGSVFSTDKPVWFAGRATWLYATLYHRLEHRPEWLDLARHGFAFSEKHCFAPDGKMYFSVTREGKPLQMRRHVYSEVFATLAYAALAEATGDDAVRGRAVDVFNSFRRYQTTPGLLPPKIDPQTRPAKSLSPLMCLISMADALLRVDDDPRYEILIDGAIEELFRDFIRPEDAVVLETVDPDGRPLDTPAGRVMNPGHAIETAWFILEVARRRGDEGLIRRILPVLDWSFERGWDREHGGLLYFLDVAGKPSPYLEHDMKLWWPHSEALYAALLAWHLTGENKYLDWFEKVHEYTFAHFPDPEYGEWFGYLRRDGSPSTDLKGNMWKGPFHIPRALWLCWSLLDEMAGQTKKP